MPVFDYGEDSSESHRRLGFIAVRKHLQAFETRALALRFQAGNEAVFPLGATSADAARRATQAHVKGG